jgi:hypothetical protein
MRIEISLELEEVSVTQDGASDCFDAVVTAKQIYQLQKMGFLEIDYDRQRGRDPVTGQPIFNEEKVERWAEQLIKGTAYLGQLTWNFRRDEAKVEHNTETRTLSVRSRGPTIPDSYHRHMAIIKAVEASQKGSQFDIERKFSVRVFNVTAEEEKRIFYAYNQEGQKADATRSKWFYQDGVSKLAASLVERSIHLQEKNVDTVRNKLSRRNPRLCAFNTLSRAFDTHWSDVDVDDEDSLEAYVDYLLKFWNKLVEVRPELGHLSLEKRQRIREASLVDAAVAIAAYVGVARKMWQEKPDFTVLENLSKTVQVDGKEIDFFDRKNPTWLKRGVVVPSQNKKGETLGLRNTRAAEGAMFEEVAKQIGVYENSSVYEFEQVTLPV